MNKKLIVGIVATSAGMEKNIPDKMEEYVNSENLGEFFGGGIAFVSADDFKTAARNCLKAPNEDVVGFIVKEENLTPEALEKMHELESELGIPLYIINDEAET